MADEALPRSVIAFMSGHIDHVVKLELLIVLHASRLVSVPIAARTLDVSKRQVRDMANELVDENLVRVSGDRVELAPKSVADRVAISDLASWYARDRTLVLDVLRALGRF